MRNAERVREAIRSAYLTTPDLDAIRGTALGRAAGRHRLPRPPRPLRRTAARTTAEARFERATEPAGLKDRALALLTA